MTVTLHLTPELEAGLSAQSWQSGWVLEDYLLTLIENAARPSRSEKASPDRAEAVHRMLAIGEKHHLSLGEPTAEKYCRNCLREIQSCRRYGPGCPKSHV